MKHLATRRAQFSADLPAILAIAATYAFFLLFDQFAFLDLLQKALPAQGAQAAMAAMGIAGLLTSLGVAARLGSSSDSRESSRAFLLFGFALAAAIAWIAPLLVGEVLLAAAAITGIATALITVPLAASLRDFLASEAGRTRSFGLRVGFGTGMAYFFCNLPPVFAADAAWRSYLSGGVAIVGLCAAWRLPFAAKVPGDARLAAGRALSEEDQRSLGLASLVLSFLALVWLDSAAFAVIQESAGLKGQTWGGGWQTVLLGTVHLLAALLAGKLIDRGYFRGLLLGAFGFFVLALGLLSSAGDAAAGAAASMSLAGPIYAVAVSVYSVALVAFPAYGREGQGISARRWRAGLIFGIAGWIGSALGVGMAQDLHQVPNVFLLVAFLLLAVAAFLAHRSRRSRRVPKDQEGDSSSVMGQRLRRTVELHGLTFLCLLAGMVYFSLEGRLEAGPVAASLKVAVPGEMAALGETGAVARGRRVYIAEGCIYCHSQFVRPGTPDEKLWGPHHDLDRAKEKPPLIGLRRQGPDLSNVGQRHDAEFLERQLRLPRSVVVHSAMPSYAYLFAAGDSRGQDLIAYLESLR